jgi:hypothetical protein
LINDESQNKNSREEFWALRRSQVKVRARLEPRGETRSSALAFQTAQCVTHRNTENRRRNTENIRDNSLQRMMSRARSELKGRAAASAQNFLRKVPAAQGEKIIL